jgi:hypothetical protein
MLKKRVAVRIDHAPAGPDRVSAHEILREANEAVTPVSNDALWLWRRLRDFETRGYLMANGASVFAGMTDGMQADVRRLAPMVIDFLKPMAADKPDDRKP